MAPLQRIALIGNSLPRRCGIATFTTDLQQSINALSDGLDTSIIAMNDEGHCYQYPNAMTHWNTPHARRACWHGR